MNKFEDYIRHIESEGAADYAIAKIVPPADWSARKNNNYKDELDKFLIKSYAKQTFDGTNGIYRVYTDRVDVKNGAIKYKNFESTASTIDYKPPFTSPSELENAFWKSLENNSDHKPPFYALDQEKTLFNIESAFNLSKLDHFFGRACEKFGYNFIGVNSIPFVNFGW